LGGFKGGATYWYLYKLHTFKMPWNSSYMISTCLEMHSFWYPIATDWPRFTLTVFLKRPGCVNVATEDVPTSFRWLIAGVRLFERADVIYHPFESNKTY
jgi:hypothetical protein